MLGTIGLAMLFQYQNCAPAGGARAIAGSEAPMPVGVIDQIGTSSAVRFTANKVQLNDAVDTVLLDGECDRIQEGSVVGWSVYDADGNDLANGSVNCEKGRFKVELTPTQGLQCGEPYQVSARAGIGLEGNVEVKRRCAADSVTTPVAVAVSKPSVQQLVCSFELRQGACSESCYDSQGILVTEAAVSPQSCVK